MIGEEFIEHAIGVIYNILWHYDFDITKYSEQEVRDFALKYIDENGIDIYAYEDAECDEINELFIDEEILEYFRQKQK